MNRQLESLLACPRCRGDLSLSGADALRCAACGATFPVIEGIPRLNDGATQRDPRIAAEWEAQRRSHAIYTDDQMIVNRLEAEVLPRLIDWLGDDFHGAGVGPVLDLGCGVGFFGRAWAEKGPKGVPLVGMDLQINLLGEAGEGYLGRVEGDVHRLPMRDASYGAVVFANALHHVSDPVRALSEVRRILRPGGLVVAHDPREVGVIELAKKVIRKNSDVFTEYHRAFSPAEYKSIFAQAGLSLTRFAAVDPFGPLVATGLDMLKIGRLGVAKPVAAALARLDAVVERVDPSKNLGLMVIAAARRDA
jgi:LSD1 subclass zinc finger protein